MSQQTTIRKLAELVNAPVEKLLEQLAEAGMSFNGPDQVVTSTEKMKLLGFLRRTHGKADKPAEEAAAPKKITLNRSRKQEADRRRRQEPQHGRRRSAQEGHLVKPTEVGRRARRRPTSAPRSCASSRNPAPAQPSRAAARWPKTDKRRAEEAAERQRARSRSRRARSAPKPRASPRLPRRGRGRAQDRRTAMATAIPKPAGAARRGQGAATSTSPTAARTRWSPASRTTRAPPRVSPDSCT